MAGKEATIYILDLGRSMGEKRHGRDRTDLDWALEYVWDKITNTVSRRSSCDLVRIVCWNDED
jgi:ATP-dependent DNA helicase 2 subunit 2